MKNAATRGVEKADPSLITPASTAGRDPERSGWQTRGGLSLSGGPGM